MDEEAAGEVDDKLELLEPEELCLEIKPDDVLDFLLGMMGGIALPSLFFSRSEIINNLENQVKYTMKGVITGRTSNFLKLILFNEKFVLTKSQIQVH